MRNFSDPNCDTGNVDNICKMEEGKKYIYFSRKFKEIFHLFIHSLLRFF